VIELSKNELTQRDIKLGQQVLVKFTKGYWSKDINTRSRVFEMKEIRNEICLVDKDGDTFYNLLHQIDCGSIKLYKFKEQVKNKVTKETLMLLQNLPYEIKNPKTDIRIREWYEFNQGNVGVSFSGGLDSTVLLHKVRTLYPHVPAISIRGIECKENQKIIDNTENVVVLKSDYNMSQVVKLFGYPIGSKITAKSIERLQNPTERNAASRHLALTGITRNGDVSKKFQLAKKWLKLVDSKFKISSKCCYYMKEKPQIDYKNETGICYFVGTKAEDSTTREDAYLKTGCNSFAKGGTSTPLGFWTQQDILRYIVENNLPISKEYGEIVSEDGIFRTTKANRTGCFICLFGIQMEKQPNRLQRMEIDDPKMYSYAINELGYGELLDFLDIPYRMDQMKEEKKVLNELVLPGQINMFG